MLVILNFFFIKKAYGNVSEDDVIIDDFEFVLGKRGYNYKVLVYLSILL